MAFLLGLAAVFSTSLLASLAVLPFLIRRMRVRGLVGRDLNKYDKRLVPEMGGVGAWLGFASGVVLAIALSTYLGVFALDLPLLLAAFSTVTIVGFLGVVDDLIGWKKGIEQWQHALVPAFAALPLMAVKVNAAPLQVPFLGTLPETYAVPFLGAVSFGVLYSLVLVPVGITGASNAANMLAGFNGLEAGLGALITGTLALIAFFTGRTEALVLALALLAALLGFLRYNWYPARVFGGDALTLMYGAGVAAIAILGDMEKIGVLLMALFFVELGFKARHRFQSECFGLPQKDGTLKPRPEGGSLTHWVMRRGAFTEPQVTLALLSMQALVCAAVFALFWFRLF